MAKESITIYHNPNCGTSRNTLTLIRNTSVEPDVIECTKNPPTRDVLKEGAPQLNFIHLRQSFLKIKYLRLHAFRIKV